MFSNGKIQLGFVSLHLYGLVIALGIWLGAMVVEKIIKESKQTLLDVEELWRVLMWGLAGGVVGARAYHVIDEWNYYANNWKEIGMIWRGGLGIYGGILGAVMVLGIYALVKLGDNHQQRKVKGKLSGVMRSEWWSGWLTYLDLAAVGMPLGQAIGRWGNWFNQELYGNPTNLPWAIKIERQYRLPGYETYEQFHPVFAYESLGNLLIFLWLYYELYRKQSVQFGSGNYLGSYLLGYASLRFVLEFVRLDPWRWGWLTVAQWISLSLVVGVVMVKVIRWWRDERKQLTTESPSGNR